MAMSASSEVFRVFIENEAGSSTKRTFDEKTLQLLGSAEVARPYPFPYGFVLGTRSGDGDCVDCFVVTKQALYTGDVVDCVPVHLLEQIEDGEVDHKVLCVPADTPAVIAESAAAAIRAFVASVFAHIPGKRMEIGSLHGPVEAVRYVRDSRI